MIMELARREKIAGIKPDEDLDIFMKVFVRQLILFLKIYSFVVQSPQCYTFLLPVISIGRTGD